MVSNIWLNISELLGQKLGTNFESIDRFWVANRRHKLTNIISFVSSLVWLHFT
jgi:hypothetical protein